MTPIRRACSSRPGAASLLAATLLGLAAGAAAEEAYVVEMSSYVLRAAPKAGAPTAGRVQVGERVTVLERASGWTQVEIGERKGWLPDSGLGPEAPAVIRVGPMQERLAGLEARVAEAEGAKSRLGEESGRLASRVGELEQALERAERAAAAARTSGRFRDMALGGGLVILGWLAGYGFAARKRGRGTRYEIG